MLVSCALVDWMRKGVEGGVVPTTQLVKLAVIWTNTPHYIHLDGGGVDTFDGGWRPRLSYSAQCCKSMNNKLIQ